MSRYAYISCICLFFSLFTQASECESKQVAAEREKPNLLIIDTAGKNGYAYRNFTLMAQNVGFEPTYKNLYDMLEDSTIDNSVDAVALFIDSKFFSHISEEGIAQEIFQKTIAFGSKPHKSLCLLLPSLSFPQTEDPTRLTPKKTTLELQLNSLAPFFATDNGVTENFLDRTLRHDARYVGFRTGTSLFARKKDLPPLAPLSDICLQTWSKAIDPITKKVIARALPSQPTSVELLNEISPLGLLVRNELRDTTCLISKGSLFTFADIEENFFMNPLNPRMREQLLQEVQKTLYDFKVACVTKSLHPSATYTLSLPREMTHQYNESLKPSIDKRITQAIAPNKRYDWVRKQDINAAWLSPHDYVLHEDCNVRILAEKDIKQTEALRATKRAENAAFLDNAQCNLLWLELNPEAVLNSHGIYKDDMSAFIARAKSITTSILTNYKKSSPPALFVGTDITTNLGKNPVENPVIDIYGTTYSKIPSPVDLEHFWKPEVIDTVSHVKKHLAPFMPITGFFFDFEMYHAQDQAQDYTDIMDFSPIAWRVYRTLRDVPPLSSTQERIAFLREHRLFKDYFNVLGCHVENIGHAIKAAVRREFPRALIGAYAQTLPSSWVYHKLMAGLSSSYEPLILATFNTSSYHHDQWLTKNNIHILHGSVVLLSKLKSQKNAGLIDSLRKNNSFVWFNRPSRLMYRYNEKEQALLERPQDWYENEWWASEISPMDLTQLSEIMRIKKESLPKDGAS